MKVTQLGINIGKLLTVLLIVLFAFLFIFKTYVVIKPGERAVVFNQLTGNMRILREGFHFLIPFVETPTIYDIKVHTYTMSAKKWEGEIRQDDSLKALTKEGLVVYLDISVRFHPDPERLIELHKKIGKDYINKVVRPQVRSIVRLTISGFSVEEVYSGKREMIQDTIAEKLKKTLAENYIVLDEVLMRDVRFTPDFEKAIEAKQIAQQEAQRMQYVLQKEELEKKRKIIEAEGEAEAIKRKGEALARYPALIQYEYVKKIAPNIQAIITDGKTIISLGELFKKTESKK